MGLRTVFRAILLGEPSHIVDDYALRNRKAVKPSPGQMDLFGDDPKWDESAHPRAPKNAPGSHGGEFC